jgi:hypothetical protein
MLARRQPGLAPRLPSSWFSRVLAQVGDDCVYARSRGYTHFLRTLKSATSLGMTFRGASNTATQPPEQLLAAQQLDTRQVSSGQLTSLDPVEALRISLSMFSVQKNRLEKLGLAETHYQALVSSDCLRAPADWLTGVQGRLTC